MEKQSILINIAEDTLAEAQFMSKSFVDINVKRRVYANTLGVESVIKYLSDNGIEMRDVHNIHSITRVLEKIDVADILLNNIHIDVRVIFDEDKIFIPKNHKKYGITPDIYIVVKIGQNSQNLELLGYFKSDIIDENKANSDYYFVSSADLSVPETLCSYIKAAKYSHEKKLSDNEILRGRELSVLMADHDISEDECKEYMTLLLSSNVLRDSVLEYDNFETLSYDVVPILMDNNTYVEADINEEESLENPELLNSDDIETDIETNPDDINAAENTITETITTAGVAGTAAGVAGALSTGAVTGEAMELVSKVGDFAEEGLFDENDEPAPEISVEDIKLEEDLNIEPLEIEDLATEIPLNSEIETPQIELFEENDVLSNGAEDVFDEFEEFGELDEPTEIIDDITSEISPSEALIEEEIEFTETPMITEDVENSIAPTDDNEEVFKNSEYDDLFDSNNAEEPTYKYAQQSEELKSPEGQINTEDDDFLANFDDYTTFEEFPVSEAIDSTEQAIATGIGKVAFDNSTSISDKNITVGEIPIDINNIPDTTPIPTEHLENIYNDSPDMVTETPLNNSVKIGKVQPHDKTKAGVLAGVGALVVLAGLSFTAMKMMKPADQTGNAPLPPDTNPQTPSNNTNLENLNTLNLDNSNVVNMNNNNSATVNPNTASPTAQQPKKMPATSFISVRKLSWEVPDYISYNADFKQYFQSAGKSLKAGLSSDLLLADEYAYSDQVRLSILYDKTGAFKEAKILLSSGSAQIDKIVLRSVNQTLSVLKAPQSVGNDESTTVILKIYF